MNCATSRHAPGLDRVRELMRYGEVDAVLAYAVDRLSRNQNHIGILIDEVEQAEVKLEFVTEKFEVNRLSNRQHFIGAELG